MKNLKELQSRARKDVEAVADANWLDLWGFDNHLHKFRELVGEQRLPSVILFSGREGLGKRKMALAAASLLGCEAPTDGRGGCGQCSSCLMVRANDHPDLLVIEPEGASLKVQNIEPAWQHLGHQPKWVGGPVAARIVVIYDIELLTKAAVNRLLKILEEPPEHGYFILTSSRVKELPSTILSRCLRWHLAAPETAVAKEYLLGEIERRGGELTEAECARWLRHSGGACGPILALINDESASLASRRAEEQLFTELVSSSAVSDIIAKAQKLTGEFGIDSRRFSAEAEMALNGWYRQILLGYDNDWVKDQNDCLPPDSVLEARRRFISRMHEMTRKKIPFNSRLACEALGLHGLPDRSVGG